MNWVKVRGTCTVRAVFEELRQQVKNDIAEYNGLHEADRGQKGRVETPRDDRFAAMVDETDTGRPDVVLFDRKDDYILVHMPYRPETNIRVKASFDNENTERVLWVGTAFGFELWQISKLALSPILFD